MTYLGRGERGEGPGVCVGGGGGTMSSSPLRSDRQPPPEHNVKEVGTQPARANTLCTSLIVAFDSCAEQSPRQCPRSSC